jgi:hypothetical protein
LEQTATLKFWAIRKDWNQARQSLGEALRNAKTNDERTKIRAEKQPKPEPYAQRCLELAKAYPGTTAELSALCWAVIIAPGTQQARQAFEQLKTDKIPHADLALLHAALMQLHAPSSNQAAKIGSLVFARVQKDLNHPQSGDLLVWVSQAAVYNTSLETFKLYGRAVDLLVSRFADRPNLQGLCRLLGDDNDPPWAEKQLRTILEKNKNAGVIRAASFSLASILQNQDESSQQAAEELYRRFIAESPKKQDDLVERAKDALEEIKLRGLGKPTPEIVGEDLQGKPLKLSDYKGKVVLLDFWGFW